jgi:gas vesicle protein
MDNILRTKKADTHDSISLLIGLFIGALAGLGMMMLLAPQSGKKTRAQLRQKSTELQDRAVCTFDGLVALSRFDNRKFLARVRGMPES